MKMWMAWRSWVSVVLELERAFLDTADQCDEPVKP